MTDYKFPKTPGACVDRLYALDELRADNQRTVDAIKKEYDALERHILDSFPKSDLDGAIGKKATAKITRTLVPQADDWDKLQAHIVKTKSWDLIQRRLSSTACRERWNAKKEIPGVSTFTRVGLSLTKR